MFESQLSARPVLRVIQAALVVAVASSPWRPRASPALRLAVLAIASLVGSGLASAQPGTIVTVAGNGAVLLGDGSPASAAQLASPADVAVDGAGSLYIADPVSHRVRRVSPAGIITTVAGTGNLGYGGDGGPATEAQLEFPEGVAVDGLGNLYIADYGNHRVRKVDPAGVITTVAGTGERGYSGDGGSATGAQLAYPRGVAVDGLGSLYIADYGNHRVRKVDPAGVITTVAGTGERGYSGDGGSATGAQLAYPRGVAVDRLGSLYIADYRNHRVRKVDPAGVITTVAGTGNFGYGGDGGPATEAQLVFPEGVAVDRLGSLYIADSGNQRVRRVDPAGVITTVAGTGERGYSRDGGSATGAQLAYPRGVAVDGLGNLYIAEGSNHRVRRVDRAGIITTVAGSGQWRYGGDGGSATGAQLAYPRGVAVDVSGNLYIADHWNHRVRRVDRAGVITTVAGTGNLGYGGDGGPATEAQLAFPEGVAVDRLGSLYIADSGNHRVRRVDRAGVITTVAGTGDWGYGGDGGSATGAQLANPRGVAVDVSGNLYIADHRNHRVRRVDRAGVITTVAGTGEPGYGGDGGSATGAQLANPRGVAVDGLGNLYITGDTSAYSGNHRVRKVDSAGVITTVAGTGERGYSGDGGPATEAQLVSPSGVAVDGLGSLYIADYRNHRVRKVDSAGVITTVAGTGERGYSGDGGSATGAWLWSPRGVAVDAAGNLYIADLGNHRVRKVDRASVVTAPPIGTDDHGNDAASATRLALNSLLDGRIETAGDEDWFRLETNGPRNVRIRTTGGLDTVGTLFDASNRQLATDDDGGDGLNFALQATVAAGVYYVRVQGFDSDTGNYIIHENGAAVTEVSATGTGVITTVAGTGEPGYGGDGGPATGARLHEPSGVVVDAAGNLFIADQYSHRVRRVDPAGVITTVAGTGAPGYGGDGGPATGARIAYPSGVAVDRSGNLYIAGRYNHRVRRVDPAGVITTVAGTGEPGYGGDGGPATGARLHEPRSVAVDAAGNLFIADAGNHRVRRVDPAGVITTVAGTGEPGYGGDGGPATGAHLAGPFGVAMDGAGNLYIAEWLNRRVRRVDPAGVITTVAGTGALGYGGDGGPAANAQLASPSGVAVDGAGNLYVADSGNGRVRKVDATGVITTVAGTGRSGYGGDGGPASSAQLASPSGVAVDGAGNLYVADTSNHRVRRIGGAAGGGPAPPVAAVDHGNDASSATRLALNSSLDGRIETAGDEDWFRLETSGPRDVRIRTTGGLDTVGTLFDASNRQLATDDDGGDGLNFALQATVAAGVYYVRVQGFDSETGNYTIQEQGHLASQLAGLSSGYRIDTFAGSRERGDGGPATEAQLASSSGVTVDGTGNLYIADTYNNRIRKVDTAGIITTIAGTGEECGWSGCLGGDGGPATEAQLAEPSGVTVDGAGNLYIADTYNHRIRKVDPAGTITTVAGSGRAGEGGYGFGGDGRAATQAELAHPTGVAVDAAGNLYIADTYNNRIRKVDAAGIITTIVGTGQSGFSGDGGPAVQAQIHRPGNVTVDRWGNLYIADEYNHRVRKVNPAGVITTVAGTGEWGYSGDGGPAALAQLDNPQGIAVDGSGSLYIADSGNHRIRKVDAAGIIATIVGTGRSGFSGDGGPATSAQLYPAAVAVDSSGNVYIADSGNSRVRRVDRAGVITTVAGTGRSGSGGDGGPAALAQLAGPSGIAVDGSGSLYIADSGNHRIRKVDPSGTITTVAGTGRSGFSGDGGPAALAQLAGPSGIAVDGSGSLYIADSGNHRIRKVDAAGIITTIVGTGRSGFSGDGGPAALAQLAGPSGIAVDGSGSLYIADSGNHRIRKVDAAGIITTVAGPGEEGIGGDGGMAVQAQLAGPSGVAVDGSGSLYIADSGNHRIRKVDPSGTITTVAGTGAYFVDDGFETGGCRSCGFSGDGGPAIQAGLGAPSGVAVDAAGNLFIADTYNERIRMVDVAGTITTVAGTGEKCSLYAGCFGGDGGPAVEARLDHPVAVAVDGAGNIYVADSGNSRIRKLTPVGRSGGTAAPDLVVQALSVSDSSLDEGASFTLRVTVRNQGTAPSSATTLRYFRSSNVNISTSETQVGTDAVGSLSASGASAESISLTAPSSAATYYYGACVDPVSGESNRGNNCSDGVPVEVSAVTLPNQGSDPKKMYWTDASTGKIQRANLDGTQAEDLVTSGLVNPWGLALDLDGGKIYWTDVSTGKIQRANLDGTQAEDLVTLLGLVLLYGLALDLDGGKIYWTEAFMGKIQRANLDGTQAEDLVTSGLGSPSGLALDLDGGKMYWTDAAPGKIQRADLDGTQVEDLVTSGLVGPYGLALDLGN